MWSAKLKLENLKGVYTWQPSRSEQPKWKTEHLSIHNAKPQG